MKYIIKTTSSVLPISDDEVEKVVIAMDKKMVVVLRAGVVSGAFIISLERDINADKGYNFSNRITGADGIKRKDYLIDISKRIKKMKEVKLLE